MKLSLIRLLFLGLIQINMHYCTNSSSSQDEIDEDEASLLDDDDIETKTEKKENEPEAVFNKLNVFRIRSEKELGYMTELLDFVILQFYYTPFSVNSQRVAAELIKVNKRIDGLAVIAAINCEQFEPLNFKHCKRNDYSTDSFPKIRLFVPPEKRFDMATKELKKFYDIPYTDKELKETNLFNFIVQNIPNKSMKLDSYSIVPFLNSDSMNKVILFTDKIYPGNLFRGLTNNYYDKLLFGTVHASEESLLEKYNITSLPTLMVYKTWDKTKLLNEPETHFYEGNQYNVKNIIEFLDKFALFEKRYTTIMRGIPEETGEDLAREIDFMEIDKLNFLRFFDRYKDKKIMILFHTKNKLKMSVKKYLFESQGYFLNVFFDCKGEREFCEKTFDVKEFPTLRLYPENTFNATLPGFADFTKYEAFDTTSNSTFIDAINNYLRPQSLITNATEFSFNSLVSNTRQRRKYLLFASENMMYQQEKHHFLPFKLLSTLPEIQKYVDFVFYQDPDPSTVREMKISNYPFMSLSYFSGEKSEKIPINPHILYGSLKAMVDNLIYHKITPKPRKPFTSDSIPLLTENNALKSACISNDICAVIIFDARENEDESNSRKFAELFDKLENLPKKEKFKELKFVWLNSTCQEDFTKQFNLTPDRGGIIVYQSWKGVYNRLAFPIDDMIMYQFFEKIVEGKGIDNQIEDSKFVIADNDCTSQIKKKIKREEKKIKEAEEQIKEEKKYDPTMKTDL